MFDGSPFGFQSYRNSCYFIMPSRLALRMFIIDFSQTTPIMGCSIREMKERKLRIDTCGEPVVEEGGYRQLSVAMTKL